MSHLPHPAHHSSSRLTSNLIRNEHTSVYLLASTHLSILDKSGQHDNGGTLATVQHLPEVPTRALQRILSNDESFLLFVALQTDRQTDRQTEVTVNLCTESSLYLTVGR